jgi:hypothetical protein
MFVWKLPGYARVSIVHVYVRGSLKPSGPVGDLQQEKNIERSANPIIEIFFISFPFRGAKNVSTINAGNQYAGGV